MERKIVEIAPRTWLISYYLLANMFLLEGDEKALLIDAGSGLGPLEEQVKSLTDKPLILALTHGHADHLGGCHLFPGVKSLIHPEDMFFAEEFTEAYAQEFIDNYVKTRGPVRNPEATDEDWKQIIRPYGPAEYGTLEDGEVFELGGRAVEVIHTPGHTSGGCCYYIEKEKTLFSGDTLFHGSVGRTDLPTGSMGQLVSSVRDRLFVLPDDTKVYPGHMEETTIGYEKKYNPFI